MTITSQNLITLHQEIDWLSLVIDQAITTYLMQDGHEKDWQDIPLPKLTENTAYGKFVIQHQLDVYSRLALALTIAPQLRPQALDIFFGKNSIYDRGFTEFGGQEDNKHGGFLPTTQTLYFLVIANHQLLYEKVTELFLPTHPLQKEQVIIVEELAKGLPKHSGLLYINQDWLTHFITGESVVHSIDNQFGVRISTNLTWDDLVLDSQIIAQVQEINAWCKHESTLMQEWGLSQKLKPGYRALFYGPPGTGKKLTVALVGKNLGKTVYQIDLAMLVSKYIGETEKNLAKFFRAASQRNWILFFDEADALFGKTTATESSNDHYTNATIAYLWQQLADFAGLIIFSTNVKPNLEKSFCSLFQNTISFPMPGVAQRLMLWENAFFRKPSLAPDIDLMPIAEKYELSGGAILNVLRYCALAAIQKNEEVVQEKDLIMGIEREMGNL